MTEDKLAKRKAKKEARLRKKPRPCMGCDDRATQWVEEIGPICDQCAQVPDEVLHVLIDQVKNATDKLRAAAKYVRENLW